MPGLQSALTSFKSAVEKVYKENKNTSAQCAKGIADAVKAWAVQGTPMTTHNVAFQGKGGIDLPSPGTGLAAAKAKFIAEIAAGYANQKNSSAISAQIFAEAHLALFTKAIVMTVVTATASPPPGTPYVGKGSGGIDKATPGKGLSAMYSKYVADLTKLYSNNTNTPVAFATELANASIAFLSEALVTTKDAGATGAGGKSTSGMLT